MTSIVLRREEWGMATNKNGLTAGIWSKTTGNRSGQCRNHIPPAEDSNRKLALSPGRAPFGRAGRPAANKDLKAATGRGFLTLRILVGYSSGQRGRTVNPPANAFDGSNPSPTTTLPRFDSFRRSSLRPKNRRTMDENHGSTEPPQGAERGRAQRESEAPGHQASQSITHHHFSPGRRSWAGKPAAVLRPSRGTPAAGSCR
jgi:hypothetical protein